MSKAQTSKFMTSLPKPGDKYAPFAIVSVCKYYGWRGLAARIKFREANLEYFKPLAAEKQFFRPWVTHQMEYWCGGSLDEKYMADMHLRIFICKQVGHDVAENITDIYPYSWGYGYKLEEKIR